jgi:hypothetical protein
MPAVAKSGKVRGRRKLTINIRSKKFGKDVEVVDSSHGLPSILARHVERCRPANFEQKFSAIGVSEKVKLSPCSTTRVETAFARSLDWLSAKAETA